MSKLVGIKTSTKESNEPVPEVVQAIKDILAQAEAGEVREFCYVATTKTDRPYWNYCGEIHHTVTYTYLQILTNSYFLDVVEVEADKE